MSQWILNKLSPYLLKFREWSRENLWIQMPLWILILWLLGIGNAYWCVYPVCWIV